MTHTTDNELHTVYVIELDRKVLKYEEFMQANPQYKPGMPCLFVGETRHTPRKRFNYHLVGYKSHEFVRRYALRLAPEHYAHLEPASADRAKTEAQRLADRLRARGCAVWQLENAGNSPRERSSQHHSWHGSVHHHFAGA